MPKQSPVPDELSKPFFDACNEDRLVVQMCPDCTARDGLIMLQHPPEPTCRRCGCDASSLEWHEVSGRGTIQSYAVMFDTPIAVLQEDQPFNLAVVQLKEDPNALFLSHLPGTPLATVENGGEVPIGKTVQVEFEVTPGNGQKVPEWRVVEE